MSLRPFALQALPAQQNVGSRLIPTVRVSSEARAVHDDQRRGTSADQLGGRLRATDAVAVTVHRMTKDKHAFTVLHTAASQIVSGDRDVIDPALVRFDPHREYPVTLPDGSIVKGRLRMHEGQIVIDLPLPEETNVFAHFNMAGTRQVWVSLMAEVSDLHAEPRLRKLLQ